MEPCVRSWMVATVVKEAAVPEAAFSPGGEPAEYPFVVLVGPTGSGKSRLAIALAEALEGEILSCDSVAVYRGLEIGSAKPTRADRERVPHHGLDLFAPDEACTAGDYAQAARTALSGVKARGRLPILAGGTGLYLRALLEGLAPAPKRNEALRERLRQIAQKHGSAALHRLLKRVDPAAARLIHPHDVPKLVRSLEVSILARQPQTEQWLSGRSPLYGYSVLRIGLQPSREALYARLNERAVAMFSAGLLEETAALLKQYGQDCPALRTLGYAQARKVLEEHLSLEDAIRKVQQGHRNYAKRQLTWFRRETDLYWMTGFGDDPAIMAEALRRIREHFPSFTKAPRMASTSVNGRDIEGWSAEDTEAA